MRTKDDLRMLQALPLELKIQLTKRRIVDWVSHWGTDGVYVSFSGGKDSTVLLHMVRELFPNVEAVFVNTGLEYPEIQQFVKSFDNVTILRPKMRFTEVIKTYGYPVISKHVSRIVECARANIADKKYSLRLAQLGVKETEYGGLQNSGKYDYKGSTDNSKFTAKKYRPLIDTDIKISAKCCDVMKKAPIKEYEQRTGKKPILATMASESLLREANWLKSGCNAFEGDRPKSAPMSFWTDQDVLHYLKTHMQKKLDDAWRDASSPYRTKRKLARKFLRNLNYRKHMYASVYGEIVEETQVKYDGISVVIQTQLFGTGSKLMTTGCDRTGCIFCAFGCHLEKELTRFQMLKLTHPRQYQYCIGGGEYDENGVWKPNKQGLGMGHVFDELNKIYGDGFIKY